MEESVNTTMLTSSPQSRSQSPPLTVTPLTESKHSVPVATGDATATHPPTETHSPSLGDVDILV